VTSRDSAYKMLRENISRFIQLTDEECQDIAQLFHPLKLNKKEHWMQRGDVCNEIAFIAHGCIRTYYTKQQIDRTSQFFFENTWYTDYESWLSKQPVAVSVQALEPSYLLIIPFRELERLYVANPKFERLGRLMAENTIIHIRNRNLSLLNDNPEERYLRLIKERPKVVARIPQHIIASFLGIEPETLSRIRKKISTKREASELS
jgi:CRP-like cAMP-binding protein